MKKHLLLFAPFLALALVLSLTACGGGGGAALTATVESVVGTVELLSGGKAVAAVAGAKLGVNDAVRTAKDGRAKIAFDDGAKILLEAESELLMKELAKPSAESTLDIAVELARGLIFFNVTKRNASKFQMDSSVAVSGVKGTKGTFAVGGEAGVQNRWVLVEGALEVKAKADPANAVTIGAAETATVNDAGKVEKAATELIRHKFYGVPLVEDPETQIQVITGGN